MLTDAQFRTLLRGRDVEALAQMQRDRKYTAEQLAMIEDGLRGRNVRQDITGTISDRPAPAAPSVAVRIIGVDLPFENMVGFMVKCALASIPAVFILVVIWVVILAVFATLGIAIRPPAS